MINRELTTVEVRQFLEGRDAYGQGRKTYIPLYSEDMFIKYYNSALQSNPGYQDIDFICLTKRRDIDSSNFLHFGGRDYRIIYTIPSRRFNQLFIRETNEQPNLAKFKITANVSPEGGGTISGTTGWVDYGSIITLTATPEEHYEFIEWTDGDTNPTKNIKVTQNVEITAVFQTSGDYIVSLSASPEGWGSVYGAGSYPEGTDVEISAVGNIVIPGTPKRTYFEQWSDGNIQTPRHITLNEDINLTAIFNYYVSIHASPRDQVSGSNWRAVKQGVTVTDLIAVAPEGQVFTGWSDGDTNNPHSPITMGDQDVILTAYFADLTPLDSPTNLKFTPLATSNLFRWSAVDNAYKYQLELQTRAGESIGIYTSYDNSFTLLESVRPLLSGDYRFRVTAIPATGSAYSNSAPSDWKNFDIPNIN